MLRQAVKQVYVGACYQTVTITRGRDITTGNLAGCQRCGFKYVSYCQQDIRNIHLAVPVDITICRDRKQVAVEVQYHFTTGTVASGVVDKMIGAIRIDLPAIFTWQELVYIRDERDVRGNPGPGAQVEDGTAVLSAQVIEVDCLVLVDCYAIARAVDGGWDIEHQKLGCQGAVWLGGSKQDAVITSRVQAPGVPGACCGEAMTQP